MNYIVKRNDENLEYADFLRIDKECFPMEPPYSKAMFDEMDKKYLWVVYDEAEAVAYMYGKVHTTNVHLSRIAVREKYRSQGIASNLIQNLIDCAAEMGRAKISLSVQSTNQRAISLYEKFGFVAVGKRCQFVLPISELLFQHRNQEQEISNSVKEQHGTSLEIQFFNKSNIEIGSCTLNPEFPGCSSYEIDDPKAQFLPSLLTLEPYLDPQKGTLFLKVDQTDLIETCNKLGFKLNYELLEMEKCG